MIFYRWKPIVVSFFLTNASLAFSCPAIEDDNDVYLWVCDLNEEMTKRDTQSDYVRAAELITSNAEIKEIRSALKALDDETCRNFNQTSLEIAFQRILQHQSLPRSLMTKQTKTVAAKVLSETSGRLDVCESQTLDSKGRDHTYQNLYYFKFGPAREQKHFLIRINTNWQN